MGTAVVILIIVALVGVATLGKIRDKKKGKGCCGECSSCISGCDSIKKK